MFSQMHKNGNIDINATLYSCVFSVSSLFAPYNVSLCEIITGFKRIIFQAYLLLWV